MRTNFRNRLRLTAATILPLVAAVLTLAPVAGYAHAGTGMVVFGAALCLTAARRGAPVSMSGGGGSTRLGRGGRAGSASASGVRDGAGLADVRGDTRPALAVRDGTRPPLGVRGDTRPALGVRGGTRPESGGRRVVRTAVHRLALMPVTVLAGVVVAALFHVSLVLGDALFVATAVLVTAGRAVGPRTVAVGRALLVPMLALFIAPVRLGPDPWRGIGWTAVAGAVALGWTLLGELLLAPRSRPDATSRDASGVKLRHDASSRDASGVKLRHDASSRDVSGIDARPGATSRDVSNPTDPTGSRTKATVHVRRALHIGVGLALAFAAGQVFFAQHWTWAVISAFTVSVGARSRGDVVLKAVRRVFGAAIGTLAASALGTLAAGRPGLTVGLILVFLAAGVYLREVNYLWWALCLTAVLALLYALDGVTGSLGLRLLAIVVGGACAVVPAVFLRPIRTRALVRKRTGEAMRSIRDAMADPAHLGRAHADLAALRESAEPLRWIRARELSWVDDLTAAADRLDTVDGRRAAGGTLRRIRAELTG